MRVDVNPVGVDHDRVAANVPAAQGLPAVCGLALLAAWSFIAMMTLGDAC